MITPEKAAANAANAQHSTGPKTDAGKARSSRNALKHGLTSKNLIIPEDQKEAFAELQAELEAELAPQGPIELLTFTNLLHAAWNMERTRQLEACLFVNGVDPLLDEASARKLDRIHRYQVQAERSFHRNLKELRTLQTNRAVRSRNSSEEQAENLPTLVSYIEIAKGTQQIEKARKMAEYAAAARYGWDPMDIEAEALLAKLRRPQLQNEPTRSGTGEENAA